MSIENGFLLLPNALFKTESGEKKRTEIYAKFLSKCNRQNYALLDTKLWNIKHIWIQPHIEHTISMDDVYFKLFCIWNEFISDFARV